MGTVLLVMRFIAKRTVPMAHKNNLTGNVSNSILKNVKQFF